MSGIGHYGANWGWVKCREAVMKEAIQYFVMGNGDSAELLRYLASNALVIREDTLKDAPIEHCQPGCECGVSLHE